MDEETTETSVVICWEDPMPEECRVDYCDPLGIDQTAPHCDPIYTDPNVQPTDTTAQVPMSTPTAVQADQGTMTPQTAAPAVVAHVESLPYTGIEGTLALLGAGLVAVGLALVRMARERSCKVLRPVR